MNEWVSGCLNGRQWVNGWMDARLQNEWERSEWTAEWLSEWMGEWTLKDADVVQTLGAWLEAHTVGQGISRTMHSNNPISRKYFCTRKWSTARDEDQDVWRDDTENGWMWRWTKDKRQVEIKAMTSADDEMSERAAASSALSHNPVFQQWTDTAQREWHRTQILPQRW